MKVSHCRLFIPLVAAGVWFLSGCATSIVRSDSAADVEHVFPATTFDAQFFWEAGVKGEPLFTVVDPHNNKNRPPLRLMYGVGALVDFPISIAFDTILLPLDLIRLRSLEENSETNGEQDSAPDASPVGSF